MSMLHLRSNRWGQPNKPDAVEDEGVAGEHEKQKHALEDARDLVGHAEGDLRSLSADIGQGQQQATTVEVNALHEVPGKVTKGTTGTIKNGAPLLIGRRLKGSELNGSVQDVRFYSRVLNPTEVIALGIGPDMERLVKIPADKRTKEEKEQLASALLGPLPEYAKVVEEKGKAQAALTGIENDPANTTMVMEDLPKPRDTFILNRGVYDKHGAKVDIGVPSVLNPLPKDAPKNRLGLARWIASPENPLTARVRVNRLWEKFFGVGIVKSSENFGETHLFSACGIEAGGEIAL